MSIKNNFRDSIKKQSNHIDNHINKGNYYLNSKQWNLAKKSFEDALLCDYKNYEANKGKLFSELKVRSYSELIQKNIDIKRFSALNILIENATKEQNDEIEDCINKYNEYKLKRRAKNNKILKITIPIFSMAIIIATILIFLIVPMAKLRNVSRLLENNNIEKAISYYEENKLFITNSRIKEEFKNSAKQYKNNKEYENAAKCYSFLNNKNLSKECYYMAGLESFGKADYKKSAKLFKSSNKYKDSELYYNYCIGKNKLKNNDYSAYTNFVKCKGFKDSDTIITSNETLNKINKLQGRWIKTKENNNNSSNKKVVDESDYILINRIDRSVDFDMYSCTYYKNGSSSSLVEYGYNKSEFIDFLSSIKIINNKRIEVDGKILDKTN